MIKLAYITNFVVSDTSARKKLNPKSMGHWGRCYYIARSIKDESIEIQYIDQLKQKYPTWTKVKARFYRDIAHKNYYSWAEPASNQDLANQILENLLALNPDIVLSPDINLISYLNCDQPIVLWVDTLYAGLINFYSEYSNLCRETTRHLSTLDQLSLNKCQLAIFSSEWAAKTAIDTYQVDPAKVRVIPSGANIESDRSLDSVQDMIAARPADKCKLIFLGVDWVRKGGDIAFKIVQKLNDRGLRTELTVIGCQPLINEPIPEFVINLGYISKSAKEGREKINNLIAESHFLILLSRAETFGNVLCEANSFGVPCIASNIGGIPTAIKDNLNGKVFSINADIDEYCDYILNLFSNYSKYKELALSSFNEYQTRLNWSAAGREAKKVLMELV